MSHFDYTHAGRNLMFEMYENETLSASVIGEVKRGIGHMFYVVDREEMSYQTPEQVPEIFQQAWPYFLTFLVVENLVLWLERKPVIRPNDGITSLSHGIIMECGRMVFRGAENSAYIYIHEHFHLVDLPWNSAWTWYLALLGVDFCYYWVHRACHEVHLLWAQHQVHHSSEEYNLAVGLRQSALQGWCGFVRFCIFVAITNGGKLLSNFMFYKHILCNCTYLRPQHAFITYTNVVVFYLPLALFIPPAQFLTHQQFNLLYQFWIHTKTINTLGPLEWIFNTPRHHRVHHGCNLYCLDKNYGGFLIIWDRIFGTFAEEHKGEEIIYGLVYNQPSFNPVFLQVFYNKNIINKWKAMNGWQDKLASVWKGPSWLPGKPRLGADEDKLDIRGRQKYDVQLPAWCNIYLCLHFVMVVFVYQELALRYMGMNPLAVLGFVAYILVSLTVIGMLFDDCPHACIFELARCLMFVSYVQHSDLALQEGSSISLLQPFFILSCCFWILKTFRFLQIQVKLK